MADNKNQHYVPRVHLRPFTLNGDGLAINLHNVDRSRSVRNAPVKSQCSGDYFYGQDDRLERAIGTVEGAYGEVIRSLGRSDASLDERGRIVLLRFAYLQHLRTEAASRKLAEMAALMSVPFECDPQDTDPRGSIKAAVQLAMREFAGRMAIVDDLKVSIARNRTTRDFFTSDDPAVLTNKLFIQRRPKLGRGFGSKSAGAILLLPLGPKLCLVAYDSAVYRASPRAGWIEVVDEADVHAINEHQILNCASNVYFQNWDLRHEVASAVTERLHLRAGPRHVVTHAAFERETPSGRRYSVRDLADIEAGTEVLVHVRAHRPTPSTWPSFLRFRLDAKACGNGAGLTRRGCLARELVAGRGYRSVRV